MTQSSSKVEETRSKLCPTTSPIRAFDSYGDDRPPRQPETICARDYDRLFHVSRDTSELLMLQATDLVPPQPCVDARLRHWGLLLCPTERGVPSKTMAFDESVMLDSPWKTWVSPWIAALRQQPQSQSIWA